MPVRSLAEILVSNFNVIIGGTLRTSENGKGAANVERMKMLLDKMDADVIRNFMEDWHLMNPTPSEKKAKDKFMETAASNFFAFAMTSHSTGKHPLSRLWVDGKKTTEVVGVKDIKVKAEEPAPKVEPAPVVATQATAPPNGNDLIGQLGQMLVNMVADTSTEQICKVVEDRAVDRLDAYIKENYGILPKVVDVRVNGGKVHEIKGVVHHKFADVLILVMMHIPVFLVGGAGTGKNVIAQQIADTLGLPFYFSNAVTQEYKITGFTDANGVYQETPFYKAFTGGGVFMLDEIDASIPEVLVILNEALANGYMDFPAPIGNVKMHKDFYVIAAGNTYGLGADYEYVGRNVIDAATLNRFATIDIDYDPAIESYLANGDTELLDFAREYRKVTRKCGIRSIMSYRNIRHMAELSQGSELSASDIMDYCTTSRLSVDDMNMMNNQFTVHNKWSNAFGDVLKRKKEVLA